MPVALPLTISLPENESMFWRPAALSVRVQQNNEPVPKQTDEASNVTDSLSGRGFRKQFIPPSLFYLKNNYSPELFIMSRICCWISPTARSLRHTHSELLPSSPLVVFSSLQNFVVFVTILHTHTHTHTHFDTWSCFLFPSRLRLEIRICAYLSRQNEGSGK